MNEAVPEEERQWFQEYIDQVRWQQAKSSSTPHSYTVREWKPEIFERAVRIIRAYGVPERFFSKTYIYLYWGNQKYWTMGSPLNETIIINRANSDTHYGNYGSRK